MATADKSPFGSRLGSQSAAIDLAFTDQLQSVGELARAAGVPARRVSGHICKLLEKGLIEADSGKYRIKPSSATQAAQTSARSREQIPVLAAKPTESPAPAAASKPQAGSRAISNRMPPVKVEYDRNGQRVAKYFANAYEARRYFAAKLLAGKNPAVRKAE